MGRGAFRESSALALGGVLLAQHPFGLTAATPEGFSSTIRRHGDAMAFETQCFAARRTAVEAFFVSERELNFRPAILGVLPNPPPQRRQLLEGFGPQGEGAGLGLQRGAIKGLRQHVMTVPGARPSPK